MTGIQLRHLEPADCPPILAVINEWWGGRNMRDLLPKPFFIHFRPTSFVAEDQGHVIGFLSGFVSQTFAGEAYIHFVGVHPDYRRSGVGRLIYEHFFQVAGRLGCNKVSCVTAPANKGSIAFHLRMGFSIAPSESTVDGVPVVENYDGLGGARVLFSRSIGTP